MSPVSTFTHLKDQFLEIDRDFSIHHQEKENNDTLDDLNDTRNDLNNSAQHSSFLTHILNNKFNKNLEICRDNCVQESVTTNEGSTINEYQETLGLLEVKTSSLHHGTLQLMQEEYNKYQTQLKTRRFSVDFDQPINVNDNDADSHLQDVDNLTHEEDYEVYQLRQRLLGMRRTHSMDQSGETTSIDKQLQNHENIQENLVQDMTKLVSSLKEGAVAFQTALDEDQKILGAAEIGIQVASKGISNVSGKLKNYDKNKLGWIFYIMTTVFMTIGLLITFVIIKLFPAL